MGMGKDHQPGQPVPTPILRIRLGGPEVRRQNLLLLAKANDVQRGQFKAYFTQGRPGRYPQGRARDRGDAEWRVLKLYDTHPAVGTLRHPLNNTLLWVCVNGRDKPIQVQLRRPSGMSLARAEHEQPLTDTEHDGVPYLTINLQARRDRTARVASRGTLTAEMAEITEWYCTPHAGLRCSYNGSCFGWCRMSYAAVRDVHGGQGQHAVADSNRTIFDVLLLWIVGGKWKCQPSALRPY